jgi:hypothetical protein
MVSFFQREGRKGNASANENKLQQADCKPALLATPCPSITTLTAWWPMLHARQQKGGAFAPPSQTGILSNMQIGKPASLQPGSLS